jgi:hypothetical protein
MAKEQEVAFKKADKKFNDLSALKINTSTGRYTVDGKSLTTTEYRKVVSEGDKTPIKTLQNLYYPDKSAKQVQTYATACRKTQTQKFR